MPKGCIACGMPLEKAEDYPRGDESKEFCIHCARPDGTMQSYGVVLGSLARHLTRTQGLDDERALRAAGKRLSRLPAWQGRKDGPAEQRCS